MEGKAPHAGIRADRELGNQLSRLRIAGIGVTTVATYAIQRVDSDYFSDEG